MMYSAMFSSYIWMTYFLWRWFHWHIMSTSNYSLLDVHILSSEVSSIYRYEFENILILAARSVVLQIFKSSWTFSTLYHVYYIFRMQSTCEIWIYLYVTSQYLNINRTHCIDPLQYWLSNKGPCINILDTLGSSNYSLRLIKVHMTMMLLVVIVVKYFA